MKINDAILQSLAAPTEAAAKLYSDDSIPNFAVRVTRAGSKSFVLTVGKERQRITIGRYGAGGISLAEARRKAIAVLHERELGVDHKPVPVFRTILNEYLARRGTDVRPSTQQADSYLFKRVERLSRKKLSDVSADDIEKVLDAIDAPSTRRSVYIRLSGLFNYAVRRGYIDRSPVRVLDAPPDQQARNRVLTDDELRKMLLVAQIGRIAGDQYSAIVELLVYTGQRANQIGALHRSEVDFAADTITWEPDRMKTGKRHTIPMGTFVRERLEGMNAADHYFPNRAGGTFCGWSYHFKKLVQEVGFADFVVHDIRRTMATRWQEMGIEIATTEKMLSHSAVTGGLVGIYQRSTYLTQMRAAVLQWEDYLHSLLSTQEDQPCQTEISQTSSPKNATG